jgi:hypothetical protein
LALPFWLETEDECDNYGPALSQVIVKLVPLFASEEGVDLTVWGFDWLTMDIAQTLTGRNDPNDPFTPFIIKPQFRGIAVLHNPRILPYQSSKVRQAGPSTNGTLLRSLCYDFCRGPLRSRHRTRSLEYLARRKVFNCYVEQALRGRVGHFRTILVS